LLWGIIGAVVFNAFPIHICRGGVNRRVSLDPVPVWEAFTDNTGITMFVNHLEEEEDRPRKPYGC
ncbi:hypothetical protein, partial [Mucilaginibacter humi]|uniref:hypothetical protein n=1 Tax=Mucilaginibacter humi TaxID=2732510 RepID=UPI001FE650D6